MIVYKNASFFLYIFLSTARRVAGRADGGALSLLPATRKPLQLRSGEQNLHIPAAGFRPPRRPAASALCSPLPASPCGSVPGSKIFTFLPPDFVLPAARRPPLFAPRSPRTLMAPFRGAKSSHFRRRISSSQAHGGLRSLLPALREPLWLRSGEQNLHISAARFRPLCRPVALCFQRRYHIAPENQIQPLSIVFFLYKFKKRPFWSSKPPFGFISMSYEIRKKNSFLLSLVLGRMRLALCTLAPSTRTSFAERSYPQTLCFMKMYKRRAARCLPVMFP